MATRVDALSWDAHDPVRLASFWAGVLRAGTNEAPDGGVALLPVDEGGLTIRFRATQRRKTAANRAHLDLTSGSLADQRQTVSRALGLGARPIDVGQRPEEGHVVLADPEGNEFCVVGPGNDFLAGCGFVGALACDGSQAAGYFWSAALSWPLVWDQDEETAIRSPDGGPKISWGGPPLTPRPGWNRLRLDIAAAGELRTEIDRLVALGATVVHGADRVVVLVDPDDNEFHLVEAD